MKSVTNYKVASIGTLGSEKKTLSSMTQLVNFESSSHNNERKRTLTLRTYGGKMTTYIFSHQPIGDFRYHCFYFSFIFPAGFPRKTVEN